MTRTTNQAHQRLAAIATVALGLAALIELPALHAQTERRSPPLSIGGHEPTADPAGHPISYREGSGQPIAESSTSIGWWLGPVGIVLTLAAFGGLSLANRRGLLPTRRESGPLEVVGRVSLSARHAVYLLRTGDRVLIVGTGSQGPPTLLGELTDPAERVRLGLVGRPGSSEPIAMESRGAQA